MATFTLDPATPVASPPKDTPTGGKTFTLDAPAKASMDPRLEVIMDAAKSTAPIADLILGIPAQMASVPFRAGAKIGATLQGADRKLSNEAGQAAADYIMEHNPLSMQKWMKALGYGEDYDKSKVTQAMQLVGTWIDRADEFMAKQPGLGIERGDVVSIVEAVMAGGGAEGVKAITKKLTRVKPLEARAALDGSHERAPAQEEPTASLLKPAAGKEQPAAAPPPIFADETQLASWLSAEGTKQATKPRLKGPPAIARPAEAFQIGTSGEAARPTKLIEMEDLEALHAPEEPLHAPIVRAIKERLKKPVPPDKAAALAALGLGAGAASQMDDKQLGELLTGASAIGMLGAMKESGGFWHPATVERVAEPLKIALRNHGRESLAFREAGEQAVGVVAADRMVKNYLNKYAATAKDPLKDIEIPSRQMGRDTITWGEAWDKAVDAKSANTFKYRVPKEIMGKKYFEEAQTFPDIPQESTVYHYGSAHREALGAQRAIHDHLSHVGDYLRTVPPEKLGQYDLVRAVKETDAADKRAAAAMEKEAAKATAQLPVVKEYPDGVKWVEIKAPEKLSAEQRESVGAADVEATYRKIPYTEKAYYPLDEKGDVMKSRFTGRDVDAQTTPEKAWLAGRLTEEGNALGHCVGGYCEGVASGDSRIFSLRDEKGRSHVTVEVKPNFKGAGQHLQPGRVIRPDDFLAAINKVAKDNPPDITQIRGKQNRPPEDKYVPYVQDLIKSGNWGKVYELDNARLIQGDRIDIENTATGRKLDPEDIGLSSDKHYTEQEVADALQKASKDQPITANYRRLPQRRMPGEAGFIDPRLARSLAAASLGVAAGAYIDSDNPLTGAVLGAGAGLVLANGRAVVNSLKNFGKADTRIRVDHLADNWEGMIKEGALNAYRVQQAMTEIAPRGDFKKVTAFLEGDRTVQLTPEEAQAAKLMLNVLTATQRAGVSAGVMSNALENYMRRVWLDNKALAVYMNAPRPGATLYQGMKQTNKAPTIAEGKAAGLKPISEDARHLLGVYVNSVIRSIAARDMATALKNFKSPAGEPVVLPAKGAPMGWARINNPHLMGSVVHPDIAPSVRFVLENSDPGMIMKGLEGINLVAKRLNVSFSLFHAKALLDAYIGAGGDLRAIPGIAAGSDRFLQALKKVDPSLEKYIQLSRKNGLEFSLEGVASDDVRTTKAGFKALQSWMDAAVPGMGALGRGIEHINALSDRFMWERLHAGMKLNIFTKEFDRLQKSNAAAHAKNPNIALMGENEIAKIAASYTNDLFGGLNWRRVAESMHSRFGRDLALELFKPSNRRITQLLMFAPDWTISTFRAATGAFGGGLKGTALSRMHRMYLVRSAIYYAAIAEAINYPMSGHHIWQNNDPTRIDLGNGQTMQWSKHFMEPFHWATMPIQQTLNKTGIIPKTAANFFQGTEYLSSQGHSPKAQGGRFNRLARQFLPISVAQQFEAGPMAGISGFFGAPIYGKATQQRENEKLQRKLDRQIHETPEHLKKRLGRGVSGNFTDVPATDIPRAEWAKRPLRLGTPPATSSKEVAEQKITRGLERTPKHTEEEISRSIQEARKRKVSM